MREYGKSKSTQRSLPLSAPRLPPPPLLLLLLLMLLATICVVEARYTCRQSALHHGHITCRQRNPSCHIVDDHRLANQERQEILQAHNRIRREAAKGLLRRYGLPSAANMKLLEWDDDLANNAQAHVEVTCQLKHDQPDERTTGTYPDVGQNIYITEVWGQELLPDSWADVVEELWGRDEAAKLRANSFGRGLKLRGHDLKTIGHLTQLLWADTEKVGCGKIVFEARNGATSDLRTCDYGEGGNVIGGEMYIEGPACSACPASHPYCDDGLCSRTPVATATAAAAGITHYPAGRSPVTPVTHYSVGAHGVTHFVADVVQSHAFNRQQPQQHQQPQQQQQQQQHHFATTYTWSAPVGISPSSLSANAPPSVQPANTFWWAAPTAYPLQQRQHQQWQQQQKTQQQIPKPVVQATYYQSSVGHERSGVGQHQSQAHYYYQQQQQQSQRQHHYQQHRLPQNTYNYRDYTVLHRRRRSIDQGRRRTRVL